MENHDRHYCSANSTRVYIMHCEKYLRLQSYVRCMARVKYILNSLMTGMITEQETTKT